MLIIICIALALGAGYFIVYPHTLAEERGPSSDESGLPDQKGRLDQVLYDLEFDYATQKVQKEDYERTKQKLERELADVRGRIERTE